MRTKGQVLEMAEQQACKYEMSPLPRVAREQLEEQMIGPFGIRAVQTKGRLYPEAECDIRTCFQRDVDRITHSKAFRRLKQEG